MLKLREKKIAKEKFYAAKKTNEFMEWTLII